MSVGKVLRLHILVMHLFILSAIGVDLWGGPWLQGICIAFIIVIGGLYLKLTILMFDRRDSAQCSALFQIVAGSMAVVASALVAPVSLKFFALLLFSTMQMLLTPSWWRQWIFVRLSYVFFPNKAFLALIEKVQSSTDETKTYIVHCSGAIDVGRPIGNNYLRMLANALQPNTMTEHMFLSHNVFDGHGLETLCNVLSHQNVTVKYLALSSNWIGIIGAKALARTLHSNSTLLLLGLDNCHIGSDGIVALARGLVENQTLQHLSLDGNPIKNLDALGVGLMKNTSLKSLSLCNIALKTPFQLDICNSPIGAETFDGLFRALEQNQTLEELNLDGNNIMNVNVLAAALTRNTSLKKLWLCNNALGDAGVEMLVEALQVNVSLERLFISQNAIGVRGVKALVPMLSRLVQLDLSLNGFGDEGAYVLAKALTSTGGKLQWLHCRECSMTDKGVQALEVMLRVNVTLLNLFVDYPNSIALHQQITGHLKRNRKARRQKVASIEDGDSLVHPKVQGSVGLTDHGVVTPSMEHASSRLDVGNTEAAIGIPYQP